MSRRLLSQLFVFVFIFICGGSATFARDASITRKEARALVLVELKHEGYDIASTKFELDDNKSWALGYYTFDAYFDTPDRFAHIDSYSVDPETAELWEIMSCKTLTAPSVQRLQQEFRAKRHLPMRSKQKYAPCDTYLNSR